MKKLLLSAAAVAALTGGTIAVSPAAHAAVDKRPCVSQSEFAQAKKGMAISKVHGIFDTPGKRVSFASAGGYTVEIRSYKTCSAYGSVAVSYENGKLTAKSGVF
jgi:hypothetical protein